MKILFLNILSDDLEMANRLDREVHGGSYSELFRLGMGIKKEELMPINAVFFDKFPAFGEFDGIVIGGSVHNPIDGEEKLWMKRVYEFVREATVRRIPMLGVCGGHQFIARAFGNRIVYNPKGREFGTKEIRLTEDGKHDELFYGLPEKFKVQLSHQCIVLNRFDNWRTLASSDMCDIQAIAPNFYTRTVQFHLELGASRMRSVAQMRKANLIQERFFGGEAEFQDFLASIEETPCAERILRNFVKYFVAPA